MSPKSPGAAPSRRAPRLGPDELIAGYFTRLGRFRKVDPTTPAKLPSVSKVLGVIGWAVLLEESVRRAVKASREAPGPRGT
ncbi:MAG: hypothetical protein H0V19_08795 [Euzebyales bacterium]|nr:hypothetical protein [Euzebyales bacterium]MBA3622233.1 hypothetical protein [Euzebyales bacterium]